MKPLTVLLALTLLPSTLLAQKAKDSSGVVKVSAVLGKADADGNQDVTITIKIDPKYHLYANPVGNDSLKAAQTSVTFSTKLEGEPKFEYPAATKEVKDDVVGNYKTYEGSVTIKARVKRVKGDTGPLDLSVKLQACDDKSCLLPATIKVTATEK
jgi:hypothetical protein